MSENIFATPQTGGGTEFVKNLYTDEIRSGFLVTSHRKKLWNVQIGLINEVARICKKHNLHWVAFFGTMLGAARHKGFIPWDDDVDLVMLRPDYDKFLKVAAEEIKYPYYLDHFYDYRRSDEENFSPDEEKFPLLDYEKYQKQEEYWPIWCSFTKLRDSRTTFIESPKPTNCHKGISIDIFPFDPIPPFTEEHKLFVFHIKGILHTGTFAPKNFKSAIENNKINESNIGWLQEFLNLTFRQRGLFYEKFLADNFYPSEYVGRVIDSTGAFDKNYRYTTADFDDIIYLPFEKIEVPVPANYDEHLKTLYGDWHKLVFTHYHAKYFSADIPYSEYFKKIDVAKMESCYA